MPEFTESEWAQCTDLDRMLEFAHGRINQRAFRQFMAACCRRLVEMLPAQEVREAVDVIERCVERPGAENELKSLALRALTRRDAARTNLECAVYWALGEALNACGYVPQAGKMLAHAEIVADQCQIAAYYQSDPSCEGGAAHASPDEAIVQCGLLRNAAGLLFQ